jgi:hypothetical protein
MSIGILFWVLMLLWCFWGFPGNTFVGARGPLGSWLLGFVLFGLLGWEVFGPALHK